MAKYYVSKGKALTTKVGIIGEGVEITSKMVEGGEKTIELLKEAKLVTTEQKKEAFKPVEKKEEVKK